MLLPVFPITERVKIWLSSSFKLISSYLKNLSRNLPDRIIAHMILIGLHRKDAFNNFDDL